MSEAIQQLSQVELDDAYHLAYFECEQAAIEAIRRCFRFESEFATRDTVINRVSQAMHDAEVARLGDERYAALMTRLLARRDQKVPS